MLTGQRENEVAGMAWSELSDDLATWTIPASRAKNGNESIVPLAPQARAIIEAAPRYEGNPLVLSRRTRRFQGWGKAKDAPRSRQRRLRTGVLHDLRRTAATGLQKLGVRLEVTESVLNHVSRQPRGVVGIYQRHEWADEKRAALDAWGAHVEAIVEGRTAAENVTRLRRSA